MLAKARRPAILAALVAVMVAIAIPSPGQVVAQDAYQLNYFSNNATPGTVTGPTQGSDQTVRIMNTGQSGDPMDAATHHGRACASIYVFAADQQMEECCSCPITANGLITLSLRDQLTSNALTGVPPPEGVIKILADAGCDATVITQLVEGGLRAWGTHVQANGAVTETQFQVAPLQDLEAGFLGMACSFVQYLGSGRGRCSCGPAR